MLTACMNLHDGADLSEQENAERGSIKCIRHNVRDHEMSTGLQKAAAALPGRRPETCARELIGCPILSLVA